MNQKNISLIELEKRKLEERTEFEKMNHHNSLGIGRDYNNHEKGAVSLNPYNQNIIHSENAPNVFSNQNYNNNAYFPVQPPNNNQNIDNRNIDNYKNINEFGQTRSQLHNFNFTNKTTPNENKQNSFKNQGVLQENNSKDLKIQEHQEMLLKQIEDNKMRKKLERQKRLEDEIREEEQIKRYHEKLNEARKLEEEKRMKQINSVINENKNLIENKSHPKNGMNNKNDQIKFDQSKVVNDNINLNRNVYPINQNNNINTIYDYNQIYQKNPNDLVDTANLNNFNQPNFIHPTTVNQISKNEDSNYLTFNNNFYDLQKNTIFNNPHDNNNFNKTQYHEKVKLEKSPNELIKEKMNLLKNEVNFHYKDLNEYLGRLKKDVREGLTMRDNSQIELQKIRDEIQKKKQFELLYDTKLNEVIDKYSPINHLHIPISDVHPLYKEKYDPNKPLQTKSTFVKIPNEELFGNHDQTRHFSQIGKNLISNTHFRHESQIPKTNSNIFNKKFNDEYHPSESKGIHKINEVDDYLVDSVELNKKIEDLNKNYNKNYDLKADVDHGFKKIGKLLKNINLN